MDFSFTDDQIEIRKAIESQLGALVTDDALKALHKEGKWFDVRAYKALAESEMLGLALPESVGGAGMGLIELCLLVHQVGRTVAQIPVIPTLVSAALPIVRYGTEAQQKRLLDGVATGDTVLSAALVAYDARDSKRPSARAKKSGSDFLVTGTFTNVPYVGESKRVLVAAKTDAGIVVGFIDPKGKGVTVSRQQGTNDEPLSELVLSDAQIAADDVLGTEATGAEILAFTIDRTVLATTAMQYGVAEGALRLTAAYAKERKQFGMPIGAFQAVSNRMGDAYIDLESLKVCLWQAAWRIENGLPFDNALSVAKFWAAEAGARITATGQHVHGGMGFDRDYPMHRYFLTAKQLEFTYGGAQEQLRAIGDRLAG